MGKTIHIEFPYKNLILRVDIPVEKLDIDHYETIFDWWFKPDNMPNMKEVFEVNGDKNERNEATIKNILINVYADDYEDDPCCTIVTNIKASIS